MWAGGSDRSSRCCLKVKATMPVKVVIKKRTGFYLEFDVGDDPLVEWDSIFLF